MRALPERDAQIAAFDELSKSVTAEETEAWEEMVRAWEADRTQPNPYTMQQDGE